MTRHIAFSNQKGGVTKTTSSTNFAACAAAQGFKVLLVDVDHQRNSTKLLGAGLIPDDAVTILDLMTEVSESGFYTAVEDDYTRIGIDRLAHNVRENLDIIPANTKMKHATIDLASADRREELLRFVFSDLVSDYDLVVYDCPPSMDILVKNVFAVGEVEIYVPVDCGAFSDEGFMDMVTDINRQKIFNPRLTLKGAFLAKYHKTQNASAEVENFMNEHFNQILMECKIRVNTDLVSAARRGQTIFEYNSRARGAEDYECLTKEILEG